MQANDSQHDAFDTSPYEGLCKLGTPCPDRRSFVIVALTLIVMLMGATIPTPLYELYSRMFGLKPISVTLVYAAYSFAVVPTLFLFGPLGDVWGRKRLLFIAVIAGIAGTSILGLARGLEWLLVGRVFQGLGVGAVSGNATAALVEMEPNGNKRRASQIAGISLFVGLAIGSLVAGSMAEFLPHPTLLVYLLEGGLLLVTLCLLMTLPHLDSERKRFRLLRPTLPPAAWAFASASLSAGLTFAMGGLYFSLVPSYAQEILGVSSLALGGGVASIMVFTAAGMELLFWGQSSLKLDMWGLVALIIGLSLIVVAHLAASIVILMLAAFISGIGGGITFLRSVAVINQIAPPKQRGNVTSLFYAICYLALGIPIIGLGIAAQSGTLIVAVEKFALGIIIFAAIDIVLTLYLVRRGSINVEE